MTQGVCLTKKKVNLLRWCYSPKYRDISYPGCYMQPGCQLRTTSEQSPLNLLYKRYHLLRTSAVHWALCPSSHNVPFGCSSPLADQAPPHDHQRSQHQRHTSRTLRVTLPIQRVTRASQCVTRTLRGRTPVSHKRPTRVTRTDTTGNTNPITGHVMCLGPDQPESLERAYPNAWGVPRACL